MSIEALLNLVKKEIFHQKFIDEDIIKLLIGNKNDANNVNKLKEVEIKMTNREKLEVSKNLSKSLIFQFSHVLLSIILLAKSKLSCNAKKSIKYYLILSSSICCNYIIT